MIYFPSVEFFLFRGWGKTHTHFNTENLRNRTYRKVNVNPLSLLFNKHSTVLFQVQT